MKKATASMTILILSALFVTFQSYAQFNWQEQPSSGYGQGGINYQEASPYSSSPYQNAQNSITQSVRQTLRFGQRIGLSELLRLSPQEQRQIEILSLSITGQSLQGRGQLDILSYGRPIGQPQILRRTLSEVRVLLPAMTIASDLEISSMDEVYIESITAEILNRRPLPQNPRWEEQQPYPQQLLTLRVDQDIRMRGEIPLDQLVRQQLGLTLQGSEIERVVLLAHPSSSRYGQVPSAQVELNGRLVGPMRPISGSMSRTPLVVNSYEEVRSLRLIVAGDARISEISIRIGQVRPIRQVNQRPERIIVSQEISRNRGLDLSRLIPNDRRLVTSISIEAHTMRASSAEVNLISDYRQILGTVFVSQVPMKPVIRLLRPMSLNDLRLESLSPVIIDIIELEFDRSPRY